MANGIVLLYVFMTVRSCGKLIVVLFNGFILFMVCDFYAFWSSFYLKTTVAFGYSLALLHPAAAHTGVVMGFLTECSQFYWAEVRAFVLFWPVLKRIQGYLPLIKKKNSTMLYRNGFCGWLITMSGTIRNILGLCRFIDVDGCFRRSVVSGKTTSWLKITLSRVVLEKALI